MLVQHQLFACQKYRTADSLAHSDHCHLLQAGKNLACPASATCALAAPEVLLAHLLCAQNRSKSHKVDGAAADLWSAGSSLHVVLTGQLPFEISGSQQDSTIWRKYHDAIKAQISWVHTFSTLPGFNMHT